MEIRKLEPSDAARLEAFMKETPEEDRTFFKEDLTDVDTVRALLGEVSGVRFVALDGDRVAGYVRILPGTGLASHVGELRLVVSRHHRRQGIGRNLARRALVESVRELELRKLFVEVVAEQEEAIDMFKKLGFVPEAILRDHLRDRRGKMQDLLLLCHFADQSSAGLDRDVG